MVGVALAVAVLERGRSPKDNIGLSRICRGNGVLREAEADGEDGGQDDNKGLHFEDVVARKIWLDLIVSRSRARLDCDRWSFGFRFL